MPEVDLSNLSRRAMSDLPEVGAEKAAVLDRAWRAELTAKAITEPARRLAEVAVDRLVDFEVQSGLKLRRPKVQDRASLIATAEAFICDLLRGMKNEAALGFVWRSVGRDFELTRATKKIFARLTDVWEQMGWIERARGFREQGDFDGTEVSERSASTRFRALPPLLRLCIEYGMTPESVWRHFEPSAREQSALIVKTARESRGAPSKQVNPPKTEEYQKIKSDVEALNASLARHQFSFDRPPALKRVFRADSPHFCDYRKGGRFFSDGDDSYQQLSKKRKITNNY